MKNITDKKKGNKGTLKQLENLLLNDARGIDNKFKMNLFPKLILIRIIVRFIVYVSLILILYFTGIVENFKIVLAAVSFFILLEIIRFTIKKRQKN